MKTKREIILKIAQRRAMMVLDPYSRFYDDAHFDDAAAVNRIAETYGGTYTEAYSAVREEFRRQLKELA
ncbi:hypothetical protein UFOVP181_458 [uncultured Caudovirales phage]|uniref:Uncharacterized protein n=1 Tax=uncultured Caudovirales phage TaxID=2100421 RepID=A0A6J5KXA4_9CAUD|nr:hypothetical protein UFOVP57_183 [uncultured Caudovirales phage]CAB5209385.1 hypothetical protein UFOVP181_458 [uncultured Caudovirales phage]